MLHLILLIAALLIFVFAATGLSHPRVNLTAAGLACGAGALLAARYGV
jgi:hypothetical protein